ncbi:unnamed protein product [Fraxinus pennsylvanica]|uniref:Uncharacterized protein n=1 Tax=Fraxinus pennsylvanica TaxID=56036 RepID=A0AAD1Z7Z2_9LAMI|nr:unnamed protein product [Fraxinus pennsylvanica]
MHDKLPVLECLFRHRVKRMLQLAYVSRRTPEGMISSTNLNALTIVNSSLYRNRVEDGHKKRVEIAQLEKFWLMEHPNYLEKGNYHNILDGDANAGWSISQAIRVAIPSRHLHDERHY